MTNSSEHIRATEERITAALEGIAGLELTRVAEICGRYAAVFEFAPSASYSKFFSTSSYDDLSDLLSTVLDTLEHLDKEIDMNIFSADMFEYLCAEMLPSDGRLVSLTIKDVEQDTVAGPRGEQSKVIVHFVERPKLLILNKTNARAIARALGNETDNWRGATVALGVESVKVGRNTVPSIRVKNAAHRRPPANGGNAPASNAIRQYPDGGDVAPADIAAYDAYAAAYGDAPADVATLRLWAEEQQQPA